MIRTATYSEVSIPEIHSFWLFLLHSTAWNFLFSICFDVDIETLSCWNAGRFLLRLPPHLSLHLLTSFIVWFRYKKVYNKFLTESNISNLILSFVHNVIKWQCRKGNIGMDINKAGKRKMFTLIACIRIDVVKWAVKYFFPLFSYNRLSENSCKIPQNSFTLPLFRMCGLYSSEASAAAGIALAIQMKCIWLACCCCVVRSD